MKKHASWWLAVGLAVVPLLQPHRALASTITATLDSAPLGEAVFVDLDNPGGAGIDESVYAGEYDWTRSSVSNSSNNYSGPPGLGQNFIAFCVDLTQTMKPSTSYTFNVVDLAQAPDPDVGGNNPEGPGGMGATKANQIEELWGRFFSGTFTADQAAAFQVAMWQIEYGVSLTINNGAGDISFSGNTSAITQAQTWLNAIDGDTAYDASLAGLTCPNVQDQVIMVPLPMAVWAGLAMALGVMGWIGLGRRNWSTRPALAAV